MTAKKNSYAASLGTDSPSKKQNEFYLSNIRGYSIKTVREDDSALFLSKLLNEPVKTVCDPVFLLDLHGNLYKFENIVENCKSLCYNSSRLKK